MLLLPKGACVVTFLPTNRPEILEQVSNFLPPLFFFFLFSFFLSFFHAETQEETVLKLPSKKKQKICAALLAIVGLLRVVAQWWPSL
jgi:hypothetical protein